MESMLEKKKVGLVLSGSRSGPWSVVSGSYALSITRPQSAKNMPGNYGFICPGLGIH